MIQALFIYSQISVLVFFVAMWILYYHIGALPTSTSSPMHDYYMERSQNFRPSPTRNNRNRKGYGAENSSSMQNHQQQQHQQQQPLQMQQQNIPIALPYRNTDYAYKTHPITQQQQPQPYRQQPTQRIDNVMQMDYFGTASQRT